MAGEIATAFVRIRPDSSGFKGDLTRQTSGVGAAVGKSIGRAMAVGIAGGIAVAGVAMGAAVKLAVGFDKAMRNVNSIAQLSESNFQQLNNQVLNLAKSTGVGPTKLAEGLYDVVSSGFKAADAMKILRAGARAGKAGLTDTATATGAVTAVLNAYHLSASQATKVSDALFQTVNLGVINFEDLASNIGDVLPFASSLGINIQNVGAAIATMTKEGISGAETVTRIKAVMSQFLSPSKDLAAAIKAQGFASGEAMIKAKGFQGSLDALAKATGGSKTELAKLFPDIRALGGALALTGKNSQTARQDLEGLTKSSGATARALTEQAKSISFQWSTMIAKLKVSGIQVGARVFPVLKWGISEASKFVDHVNTLIERITGPTLSGKPLTFRQQVEIVWADVQPQLAKAAAALWSEVQAGIGAAWAEATKQGTVALPVTPGLAAGEGFSIPIKTTLVMPDESDKGLLHDWAQEVIAPLQEDFRGAGDKSGKSFGVALAAAIATQAQTMAGGLADQFITGPLQTLDGLMRGDAGRIAQGFVTTLGGALRASGLTIIGPALQNLGKGINDKLVAGIHAAPGAIQNAGKWINDRLVDGIHAGAAGVQSAGKWFNDRVVDGIHGAGGGVQSAGKWVNDRLVAGMHGAAGAVGAAAKSLGAKIVSGLSSELSTVFSVVVSAMSSVANAVANAATSAVSAAVSLGASIVGGIVSGLASLPGAIASKIASLAKDGIAAGAAAIGANSPSKMAADMIGQPMVEGMVMGVERNKKKLSATLTGAARQAVADAKANLLSLSGSLGDSIARIIDAQTRKRLGPLQARLDALATSPSDDLAAQRGRAVGDAAKSRAALTSQLGGDLKAGETTAEYLARQADIRQQLADLDAESAQTLADLDKQIAKQRLQDEIDAIQKESDTRRDAVAQQIADITAMFNTGVISGAEFTKRMTAILKASGASVAQAGQLLGYAFAQQFKAQIGDVTAQVIALAGLLKLHGGTAGGAGFGSSITKPLDEVKNQIKDVTKNLSKDKGQLKDAVEREAAAKKALHDATTEKQRDAATKKLRDAQADADRERREIAHDRALLASLAEIVRLAQGVSIGQISVASAGNSDDLMAALASLAAGVER